MKKLLALAFSFILPFTMLFAATPRVPLRDAFLQTPLDGNQKTITNLADVELSGFPLGPLTNLLGGVTYLEEWGQLDPSTFEGGSGLTNRFEKIGIGPDPFTPERPLHIKTELGAGVVGPTIIQENTNAVENARAWLSTVGTSETFPSVSMIWGFFYDAFAQTNRLMALDTNGVLKTVGGFGTPSNPSIDTALETLTVEKASQEDLNNLATVVLLNNVTNESVSTFSFYLESFMRGPVVVWPDLNPIIGFESTNKYILIQDADADVTLSSEDDPVSGVVGNFLVLITADAANVSAISVGKPSSPAWVWITLLPPPAIQPGEFMFVHGFSFNGVVYAGYVGNQSRPLGTVYGGTGKTTGKAADAKDVLGTVTYTSTTNATFDLQSGTVFRLDNSKDALINLLENRLSAGETNTLSRIFSVEMLPPNANRIVWVNTNNFGLVNIAQSNFVAAGIPFKVDGVNWGPGAGASYLHGGGGTNSVASGGGGALTWENVILAETWDAAGADNLWTESAATAEIDDDSGYAVSGQGLTLTESSTDRYVYHEFAGSHASLSGVVSLSLTNGYPAATAQFFRIYATGTECGWLSLSTAGKLIATHGSGVTDTSVSSVPTNTFVTLYFEWADTDSNTGVWKAGWSENDLRSEASGDQYVEITAGTDTDGPANRVRLQAEEIGTYHFDNLKVRSSGSFDTIPDAF